MRNEATPKRLLLIGGTGLVGSMLLQRAATRPDLQLTSLTRRAGQGVPINFDAMLQAPETTILAAAPQADVAISCLGTTIRKAGSEAAMFKIDHDYVLAFARGASPADVRRIFRDVPALLAGLTCEGAEPACGRKARRTFRAVAAQVRA